MTRDEHKLTGAAAVVLESGDRSCPHRHSVRWAEVNSDDVQRGKASRFIQRRWSTVFHGIDGAFRSVRAVRGWGLGSRFLWAPLAILLHQTHRSCNLGVGQRQDNKPSYFSPFLTCHLEHMFLTAWCAMLRFGVWHYAYHVHICSPWRHMVKDTRMVTLC